MNDSRGDDDDGVPRAEEDDRGTAGTAVSTTAALVGEGDFSAVLIFDVYAFTSVISLLTFASIVETEDNFCIYLSFQDFLNAINVA